MPVPFNHASLKLAFGDERGEELYQKLVETFGKDVKVPIMELRKKNDPDLAEVADYVYENVFLHYTMKQWGQTPTRLIPRSPAVFPSLWAMMTATSRRLPSRACRRTAIPRCLSICSTTI